MKKTFITERVTEIMETFWETVSEEAIELIESPEGLVQELEKIPDLLTPHFIRKFSSMSDDDFEEVFLSKRRQRRLALEEADLKEVKDFLNQFVKNLPLIARQMPVVAKMRSVRPDLENLAVARGMQPHVAKRVHDLSDEEYEAFLARCMKAPKEAKGVTYITLHENPKSDVAVVVSTSDKTKDFMTLFTEAMQERDDIPDGRFPAEIHWAGLTRNVELEVESTDEGVHVAFN